MDARISTDSSQAPPPGEQRSAWRRRLGWRIPLLLALALIALSSFDLAEADPIIDTYPPYENPCERVDARDMPPLWRPWPVDVELTSTTLNLGIGESAEVGMQLRGYLYGAVSGFITAEPGGVAEFHPLYANEQARVEAERTSLRSDGKNWCTRFVCQRRFWRCERTGTLTIHAVGYGETNIFGFIYGGELLDVMLIKVNVTYPITVDSPKNDIAVTPNSPIAFTPGVYAASDGGIRGYPPPYNHKISQAGQFTYGVSLQDATCSATPTTPVTVRVDAEATRQGKVGVAAGATAPTAAPESKKSTFDLTFTACNVAQPVTVQGFADADSLSDYVTIRHTRTDTNAQGPTVVVRIDDP